MNSIEPNIVLPLEEWKQAGTIISHHEILIFKIRAWFIGFITALSVLSFKDKPILLPFEYLVLVGVITVVFFLYEVDSSLPLRRAIDRVRKIEPCMRGEEVYDGFRLSSSMAGSRTFEEWKRVAQRVGVWLLYAGIQLFCIMGVLFLKNN